MIVKSISSYTSATGRGGGGGGCNRDGDVFTCIHFQPLLLRVTRLSSRFFIVPVNLRARSRQKRWRWEREVTCTASHPHIHIEGDQFCVLFGGWKNCICLFNSLNKLEPQDTLPRLAVDFWWERERVKDAGRKLVQVRSAIRRSVRCDSKN